jgi:hypothetical protein
MNSDSYRQQLMWLYSCVVAARESRSLVLQEAVESSLLRAARGSHSSQAKLKSVLIEILSVHSN